MALKERNKAYCGEKTPTLRTKQFNLRKFNKRLKITHFVGSGDATSCHISP